MFPVSVRDLGMVPYIKIFLDQDQYRPPTLSILEQLAEINPEEFMSTAIGALCSSTQQELRLKRDLLLVGTRTCRADTSRNTLMGGPFSRAVRVVFTLHPITTHCNVLKTLQTSEFIFFARGTLTTL